MYVFCVNIRSAVIIGELGAIQPYCAFLTAHFLVTLILIALKVCFFQWSSIGERVERF